MPLMPIGRLSPSVVGSGAGSSWQRTSSSLWGGGWGAKRNVRNTEETEYSFGKGTSPWVRNPQCRDTYRKAWAIWVVLVLSKRVRLFYRGVPRENTFPILIGFNDILTQFYQSQFVQVPVLFTSIVTNLRESVYGI